MAQLERTYIIPIRGNVIRRAKYKRAKRAVNVVKEFLVRHMKSDDVKLGNKINRELWKRGIRSPPGKIKVVAIKDDKGVVKAELFGYKFVDKKKVEKVEKSKLEQLKEKMMGESKEHSKEAITNIHEHDHSSHDHSTHEHTEKEQHAADKKERKVSSGTAKSKEKQ